MPSSTLLHPECIDRPQSDTAELDRQLVVRDVRLIDYDWQALPVERHGHYLADLFDVFMLGDHREAKALSRALEGIEVAIALERQLDASIAKRVLETMGVLKRSAATFPEAAWLSCAMDAASEAAAYWVAHQLVPAARHQDLQKWLRACRLVCEGHAIGADTRQQAATKPAALN